MDNRHGTVHKSVDSTLLPTASTATTAASLLFQHITKKWLEYYYEFREYVHASLFDILEKEKGCQNGCPFYIFHNSGKYIISDVALLG